ncbi:MAG: AAA family ATPase [Evtepia sp.]
MLSLLHIENIALIDQADISLGSGFNVLTGETGAGKSIIIDAISAVLGERTSRDLIRTGEKSALVTALFRDLPFYPGFKKLELDRMRMENFSFHAVSRVTEKISAGWAVFPARSCNLEPWGVSSLIFMDSTTGNNYWMRAVI